MANRTSRATPCDRLGCDQGGHDWNQTDHRYELRDLEPRYVLTCDVCGGPLVAHRMFGECFPAEAFQLTTRRFLSAGLIPTAPDPARRAVYG